MKNWIAAAALIFANASFIDASWGQEKAQITLTEAEFNQLIDSIQTATRAKDASDWSMYRTSLRYQYDSTFGFKNGEVKAWSIRDQKFYKTRPKDRRKLDSEVKKVTLLETDTDKDLVRTLEIDFGVSEYEKAGRQRAAWGTGLKIVHSKSDDSVSVQIDPFPVFEDEVAEAKKRVLKIQVTESALELVYRSHSRDGVGQGRMVYIFKMTFNDSLDSELRICSDDKLNDCILVAVFKGGKKIQPGDRI